MFNNATVHGPVRPVVLCKAQALRMLWRRVLSRWRPLARRFPRDRANRIDEILRRQFDRCEQSRSRRWGLGLVRPTPLRASLSACCMKAKWVMFVHQLIEKRRCIGFPGRTEPISLILFASADDNETNGQSEFARNCHDDSALGGAIELSQHNSRDAYRAGEFARLGPVRFVRWVASITSSMSCGAPGITFAAVRFIFSSSAIKLDFGVQAARRCQLAPRPALRALAAAIASKHDPPAAGSEPGFLF